MPVIHLGPSSTQPDRQAAMQSIVALMDRLADVLLEENAVLEQGKPASHDSFISRKNQILRDLIILQRTLGTTPLTDAATARLRQVRELVDRNNRLLKMQVDAMSDVTSLLTEAALAEQADGTYSRTHQ